MTERCSRFYSEWLRCGWFEGHQGECGPWLPNRQDAVSATNVKLKHTCILDDGGTPNRRCGACEAERAIPAKPDVRGIVEALGFDPTNHHNAAKCPYCSPQLFQAPSNQPNHSVKIDNG